MPRRIPRKIRAAIRHPNFWPIMQLMATVVTVVAASYIVWLTSTESAARSAREKAESLTKVTQCFDQNSNGPAADRFFGVLDTILVNQISAAASVKGALPLSEFVKRKVLTGVIKRAQHSLADIHSFAELTKSTTPTRKECRNLAKKLGVEVA